MVIFVIIFVCVLCVHVVVRAYSHMFVYALFVNDIKIKGNNDNIQYCAYIRNMGVTIERTLEALFPRCHGQMDIHSSPAASYKCIK